MKPAKLRKLIKQKQMNGPWWFLVVDGDKLVTISTVSELSAAFFKWVADCHLAGLQVDLVTEASAVGLLRRLHDKPGPLVVNIRDVQP